MRKYCWMLFKALEFMNSRMPELDIRPEFILQLESYKETLTARGMGPKTSNWSKVYEKATNDFENEELMLRNTYLNSQVGPFVAYQTEELTNKPFKLKWIDEIIPTGRSLATIIDEKGTMTSSKTQDTLPNELTGGVNKDEEIIECKKTLRINIKLKTKVHAVRVKHPLSMKSHLATNQPKINYGFNKGVGKVVLSRNCGELVKKLFEFPPARAQHVPSFTTFNKPHRSTNSLAQEVFPVKQKKALSRSNSDVINYDAIFLHSMRESRNRRSSVKNELLKRKTSVQETKKGPVGTQMRTRSKISPLKGEQSPEPSQVVQKVVRTLKLNVRIPHPISTVKISGRNINPKKMLRTYNTSPIRTSGINSVRHFNN